MIGNDYYPLPRDLMPMKVGDYFAGRVDDDRRLLSYFAHDTRAQAARKCFKLAKKLYGAAGPSFSQVRRVALDAVRPKIFDPLDYSFPRWFTHEAAKPRRAVHGRLPLIRAGVTPYEDLLTLIQDIKRDDPYAEIQLPTARDEGETNWYGLPRHIDRTSARSSFKLPQTRMPLSPVEPPHVEHMEPKTESGLSAAERKSRGDARILCEDWRLQRGLDFERKAAQTRLDDIFDPHGRKYRSDWNETCDGEVWQSPPPPGTVPDVDPPRKPSTSPPPKAEVFWSRHARFEGDGLSESDSWDEQSPELDSRPSKRARIGF